MSLYIPRNASHDKIKEMLHPKGKAKYAYTADVPEAEVEEAINAREIDLSQAPLHKITESRVHNIRQGYRSLNSKV